MDPTLLSVEVSQIDWDAKEKESGSSKSLSPPAAAAQSSIRYSEGNYQDTHTGSSHTDMTHRDTSQQGHTETSKRHLPTEISHTEMIHGDLTDTVHRDTKPRHLTETCPSRHLSQTPSTETSCCHTEITC